VALIVLLRCLPALRGLRLAGSGAFLLALAGFSLLQVLALSTGVLDRYYLPALVSLIPLAVLFASRGDGAGTRIAALAMMGLGLVVYAVGEQDYQAWQAARDQAARAAYATMGPDRVQAGFEANAVYWEIPYFEAHGTLPQDGGPQRVAGVPAFAGPADAAACLVFAPAGDPRPGVAYDSASPGKIVVQPGGCRAR
jgi:hypothetical protein